MPKTLIKPKPKRPSTYHFFNGNIKVGDMLTWSKLAGNGLIKGCKGTCGKYCDGCYNPSDPYKSACYVFKSYNQYKDHTIDPHIKNTVGIRTEPAEVFSQLHAKLSRMRTVKPVRIHAAGEFESAEELRQWIELAAKHKERPFYVYTKAFDILDEVLPTVTLPPNFFINISIWHESGINTYKKYRHLANIRAFVYNDGYKYPDDLKIDCNCPAYSENGKLNHEMTCDKCKICFQEKAKVCACYDH